MNTNLELLTIIKFKADLSMKPAKAGFAASGRTALLFEVIKLTSTKTL